MFILFAFVATVCGCATHADQLVEARGHFYAGRLNEADDVLVKSLEDSDKDQSVLKLDQAMVRLSQGNAAGAESILREIRDEFDHLKQTSLTEEALAFLTDETERAYAGEPYERVLIRVFLALSNLAKDGRDVNAYAHQIQATQEEILRQFGDQSQELAPQFQVAIGPYLRGVLAEASSTRLDEAARNYAQAVSWQPTFDAGRRDLERAEHGHHSERGNGVIYLFAFVGKGPYKETVNETPTSAALLVADQILSATGKHTLPPTIAPIKVPKVVRAPNKIDRVVVRVDGQDYGATTTVTDITKMAVAQNEAEWTEIVGRAVARRVVKKALIYGAKDVSSFSENPWLNLAADAAGVIWEASEVADTRCWGLLPDTIQVLRIEVPAGVHEIELQPASGTGPKGATETATVEVADGRNTYVMVNFPGERMTGQITAVTR